jgi:hypothetical protein
MKLRRAQVMPARITTGQLLLALLVIGIMGEQARNRVD